MTSAEAQSIKPTAFLASTPVGFAHTTRYFRTGSAWFICPASISPETYSLYSV